MSETVYDCPECAGHFLASTAGFWMLREACASVGMEHGISTDEMMHVVVSEYHDRDHKETPIV